MTRSVSKDASDSRVPPGCRVACLCSSYHAAITGAMRDSAREVLVAAGLAPEDFLDVPVPGAYELPLVAQRFARRADVAAVLCFGLVLKGETEHDRYIAQAVADGLMRVGLEADTPVLFGVLTCGDVEQARVRARSAADGGLDKGREVAIAAIEVLHALGSADAASTGRGIQEEVR